MIGFDGFLRAVRGHEPYPWQQALADRLAGESPAPEDGPPPFTIAVPTGSGKTTVVDVLVWALAAQADRPPRERTVGTRIVWAIDRRLLVDEVHRQTTQLADRLAAALDDEADALHEVATRLEGLKGVPPVGGWRGDVPTPGDAQADGPTPDDARPDGPSSDDAALRGTPLVATRWRGGLPTAALVQHPLQPEVITSTVAQIGSRLLFRGYGLGDRSLPLGAALATCDVTVCLDEAHLAEPFADTVAAITAQRRELDDTLAPPVRLLRLSATSGADADDPDAPARIDLAAADLADPRLATRLAAPKRVTLVEPDGPSDKEQETALVAAVEAALEDGRRTIACVVNSVRTARAVFDRITAAHAGSAPDGAQTVLLIGPQRPADRHHSLYRPIDGASPSERTTPHDVLLDGASAARPLVVVATQTFEVGLDADVDALITQSASAAALTQRLGRLNRRGRLHPAAHAAGEATHPDGHATVVRHLGFPLYADDEEAAWSWLASLEGDASIAALRRTPPPAPAHRAHAAELSAEVVGLLTQTSPRPHRYAEPDIDAFLRGTESEPDSDVTLCWRADLVEDDLTEGADAYRAALLRLAPPHRDEQLTVSIRAARNLLAFRTGQARPNATARRRLTTELADVEGERPPLEPPGREADQRFDGIPFLVRRGDELLRGRVVADGHADDGLRIGDVRPGDLLVLPTALGGVDAHGLAADEPSPAGQRLSGERRADSDDDLGSRRRSEKDVGRDVRPPEVSGATVPDAPAPSTPVRLTFGALDAAFAASIPRPGPRAQRVRRILRRTRDAERRLESAHDAPGRVAALQRLFTELADHPALATSDDGTTASGLTPDGVELRRLTPDLPSELTDPSDDLGGLLLGVPTIPDDAELAFDDADERPPRFDDEDEGMEPTVEDESTGGVLLPGEDRPMTSGGWVLLPSRTTAHDRIRPRDEAPPTLAAHATDVADRAAWFARAAGLSESLVTTLVLAARAHDHGKADPRMQAFFRGGVAPPLAEAIAKSIFGTDDRRADRTARLASGLPSGWRHELASAVVLAAAWEGDGVSWLSPDARRQVDIELALTLVGGHHGDARPLPRVPEGGAPPRSFAVDVAGVAGTATGSDSEGWSAGAPLHRLERVTARYGPWSLAYLQALLVLADRTVSAEGR